MYCWNCGKEIADEARFCPYCGAGQQPDAPAPEPAQAAQPIRQPEPAPKTPPRSTASTQPSKSTASSSGKKKVSELLTYPFLAVLAVVLALVNIHDMKAGDSYHVWFGIPLQYVMIPAAVLFVVLWIMELVRNKKS